jgi:hypothetical protein
MVGGGGNDHFFLLLPFRSLAFPLSYRHLLEGLVERISSPRHIGEGFPPLFRFPIFYAPSSSVLVFFFYFLGSFLSFLPLVLLSPACLTTVCYELPDLLLLTRNHCQATFHCYENPSCINTQHTHVHIYIYKYTIGYYPPRRSIVMQVIPSNICQG